MLVAAGLVLAAFLSTAGFVLDQAFHDTAKTLVQERLTGRIHRTLGMINLDDPANISLDPVPLDATLSIPESGRYAQVLDASNNRVWNSRSMLGITFEGPLNRSVGEFNFANTRSSTGEKLFVLSYTVVWEGTRSGSSIYTIQVAENERIFSTQVARFRKSLWLGFSAIGVVLLLVQTVIFRWGLKPLRDVAIEVNRIERGEKGEISGEYPIELRALTENLNALIRTNDSSLKRYRNALGDLAHSLKTPLAVIRTSLVREPQLGAGHSALRDSLDQLDSTIDYQLQRAAAAGRSVIGKSIEIAPIVEMIASSLRKVHAAREISIVADVETGAKFRGDRGDLMEILGNIADNACKWARATVAIKVCHVQDSGPKARISLRIEVQDDGAGMPEEDIARALLRGARLDQTTAGYGIGLAVVKELVEEVYSGRLVIKSSLSGTLVTMTFDEI